MTMHDPATQRLALSAFYAAGAVLAGLAARSGDRRQRTFWIVTAALLLLLMTAKELHLIDTLSRAGRAAIKAHGWYGMHREVQAALLVAVAAIALIAAAGVALWLRAAGTAAKVAATALLLLAAFLVLRAISIHAVDVWTLTPVAGMRKGWWVELFATLVICAAALSSVAAHARAIDRSAQA